MSSFLQYRDIYIDTDDLASIPERKRLFGSFGREQVIETSMKATSKYKYQKVVIDMPEDAKKILFAKD